MYTRVANHRLMAVIKSAQRFNSFESVSRSNSLLESYRCNSFMSSPTCSATKFQRNISPANPDFSSIQLSGMLSKLTVNNQSESLKEYRLPSIVSVEKDKRSILDSLDHNRACRLPTYNQLEKFTPAAQRVVSITDPNPLQRIIDQGAPVVKKEARQMSTIRIRRKKMKKHQLRRLRKRMRFLMRKLKAVKLKKKEKRMQEYEKEKKRWADEFDAEKVIDEHLVKARDCGWGIDILAERAVRRGMMAAAGGSSSNKPSDK